MRPKLLAAMLLLATTAHAQNIGFRVGIAPQNQPQPMAVFNPQPFGPIQPFVVAPVMGFGMQPMIMPPVISTFVGPTHFQIGVLSRPVVVVPVQVQPQVIYAPGSVIVLPAPQQPQQPQQPRSPQRPLPPAGTLRAEVINQFGVPIVSILTSTGETLQYPGGVVIVIQNGIVVTR